MIYVFDTSSIRSLQHFYQSVFKTIWDGLDRQCGELIAQTEEKLQSSGNVERSSHETATLATKCCRTSDLNQPIFTKPLLLMYGELK